METLTQYLIASSVCLTFAYLIYLLFFRKETNFKQRRFFLLFAVVFALLFPTGSYYIILPLKTKPEKEVVIYQPQPVTKEQPKEITTPPAFIPEYTAPAYEETEYNTPINWIIISKYIYFAGLTILLLRVLLQVIVVFVWYSGSRKLKQSIFTLVFHSRFTAPFSFFKWIFMTDKKLPIDDFEKIIAHESVHVQQKHSIDIVIFELVCAIMWFNPFVWMMRRSAHLTHEFLADEGALQTGIDSTHYQTLMLNQVAEGELIGLTSHFSKSMLSRRIQMITNCKIYKKTKYKILFLAPVAIILFLFIAGINGFDKRKVIYRDMKKDPVISKVFTKQEIKDLVEIRLLTDKMVTNQTEENNTTTAYSNFNNYLASKVKSIKELPELIELNNDSLVSKIRKNTTFQEIWILSEKYPDSFSINPDGKIMEFFTELSYQNDVYTKLINGIEIAGDISPTTIAHFLYFSDQYNLESDAEKLYAAIWYFFANKETKKRSLNTKEDVAIELNNQAAGLILQNPDSALTLINKALDLQPNLQSALNTKVAVLFRKNDIEQAKKLLQKLIEINPKEPEHYRFLGMIHDFQKNSQEANSNYNKCSELYNSQLGTKDNFQHFAIRLNLATIYVLLGEDDKAEALFKQLIREKPDIENLEELSNLSKSDYLEQVFSGEKQNSFTNLGNLNPDTSSEKFYQQTRKQIEINMLKDPVISKVFSKQEIKDLANYRFFFDRLVKNATGITNYEQFVKQYHSSSIAELHPLLKVPHDSLVNAILDNETFSKIWIIKQRYKRDDFIDFLPLGKTARFLEAFAEKNSHYEGAAEILKLAGDIAPSVCPELDTHPEKYSLQTEAGKLFVSILFTNFLNSPTTKEERNSRPNLNAVRYTKIDTTKLRKRFQTYQRNPSEKNALKLYEALPRQGHTRLKDTGRKIIYEIGDNLETLEKQVRNKKINSIKVAFRLFGISDGEFSESLQIMLGRLITQNPELFLAELKIHSHFFGLNKLPISNLGPEFVDKFDLQKEEKQRRIEALESVTNPELIITRDRCIRQLKPRKKKVFSTSYGGTYKTYNEEESILIHPISDSLLLFYLRADYDSELFGKILMDNKNRGRIQINEGNMNCCLDLTFGEDKSAKWEKQQNAGKARIYQKYIQQYYLHHFVQKKWRG